MNITVFSAVRSQAWKAHANRKLGLHDTALRAVRDLKGVHRAGSPAWADAVKQVWFDYRVAIQQSARQAREEIDSACRADRAAIHAAAQARKNQ